MYDGGDILLYSLSAWSQTTWETFKKCFDEVHRKHAVTSNREEREPAAYYRWRALRLLSSLGHIDVRFETQGIGIAINVAPPALAVLPGFGIRRAVLCGARSPSTSGDLRRTAALEGAVTTTQSQISLSPYAPARVEVSAESDERIRATAERVGIPYLDQPPARTMAQVAASLEEYCQDLFWSEDKDLNWHRENFNVHSLRFQPAVEPSPSTRLSRYQDPITTIWRYRLWRNGQFGELEPDWGRYAILSACSKRILQYDPEKRDVLVPLGTPLPALLARALGLCSGYASRINRRSEKRDLDLSTRYEIFRDVPPSIFRMVADKVGQQVAELGA